MPLSEKFLFAVNRMAKIHGCSRCWEWVMDEFFSVNNSYATPLKARGSAQKRKWKECKDQWRGRLQQSPGRDSHCHKLRAAADAWAGSAQEWACQQSGPVVTPHERRKTRSWCHLPKSGPMYSQSRSAVVLQKKFSLKLCWAKAVWALCGTAQQTLQQRNEGPLLTGLWKEEVIRVAFLTQNRTQNCQMSSLCTHVLPPTYLGRGVAFSISASSEQSKTWTPRLTHTTLFGVRAVNGYSVGKVGNVVHGRLCIQLSL